VLCIFALNSPGVAAVITVPRGVWNSGNAT
jgi:hypothetical protein